MKTDILVQAQTITPVWTGDAARANCHNFSRALAGHLRWWYEAHARALGGYACDPHKSACYVPPPESDEMDLSQACAICRLWGCRGWRARFCLRVTDARGKVGTIALNRAGTRFGLRFSFFSPPSAEESWLLDRTLQRVGEYGTLGGRFPGGRPSAGVVKFSSQIESSATRDSVRAWLHSVTEQSPSLLLRRKQSENRLPDLRFFFFNNQRSLNDDQLRQIRQVEAASLAECPPAAMGRVVRVETGTKRFYGYTFNGKALSNILMKLLQLDVRGTLTGGQVLHAL